MYATKRSRGARAHTREGRRGHTRRTGRSPLPPPPPLLLLQSLRHTPRGGRRAGETTLELHLAESGLVGKRRVCKACARTSYLWWAAGLVSVLDTEHNSLECNAVRLCTEDAQCRNRASTPPGTLRNQWGRWKAGRWSRDLVWSGRLGGLPAGLGQGTKEGIGGGCRSRVTPRTDG